MLALLVARLGLSSGDLSEVPEANVAKLCPQAPSNTDWPAESVCDNADGSGFTQDFEVMLNEVLCTFIFVSVILMVKGKQTAPTQDGIVGALTVCLTLFGLIMAGGKLGACYNPAVGVALPIWANSTLADASHIMHYMYAYIVGPYVGATIAGAFHNIHKSLYQPAVKRE